MFTRILIANRGEIAARIARTCRRLGVATVGIHSEADADALHPSAMNESHLVGLAAVRESYMNVAAILEVAKRTVRSLCSTASPLRVSRLVPRGPLGR